MSMFTKATKAQAKARVALDGPTGAGKTWNALVWATVLGDRVAMVDTERGSASLYAPHFDFDTLTMSPPYDPARLIEAVKAADAEGYDVFVIDSLSHFWEGEGGTLDIVDAAAQRAQGNSWSGWKVGTPALRHLVDTMLGCDMHLIVTMRSKMEWVLETVVNKHGKEVQQPKKIGMAPVMRAGVEYEFQVVGDLDLEHRLTISKSRCDVLADEVVQKDRIKEAGETFCRWLADGEPAASRNDIDAIRARIRALGPEAIGMWNAARQEAGLPETMHLLASQVATANKIIDGLVPPEDPDPGPGRGDARPVDAPGPDGSARSPAETNGTSPSADEMAQARARKTRKAADPFAPRKYHRVMAAKGMKEEVDRRAVIFCVTSGRTDSAGECTVDEMARAFSQGESAIDNPGFLTRIRDAYQARGAHQTTVWTQVGPDNQSRSGVDCSCGWNPPLFERHADAEEAAAAHVLGQVTRNAPVETVAELETVDASLNGNAAAFVSVSMVRRPLDDNPDPLVRTWQIDCSECGTVVAAAVGTAHSEVLADHHSLTHSNPAGAAAYAAATHLDGGVLEDQAPPAVEHQVAVIRKPRTTKKWLVTCRTCGFEAEQSSEAFANERAEAHRHDPTPAAVAS